MVTTRYPAEQSLPPERFRGQPILRPGSGLPNAAVCPVGALSEHLDDSGRRLAIDLARCVFCGRCAEGQWAGAVAIGRDFELASRCRADMRIEVVANDTALSTTRPTPEPDADAAYAMSEINRVLGRSLHLRHLDAGSCNACDWELNALLNPVYDIRRLGIDFVASPRHADGVVITGPITRNLETAVRRTVKAIPDPRIVIAVGACAASGGIFGAGYASAGGVDQILPVECLYPRLSTTPGSDHFRHFSRGRTPLYPPLDRRWVTAGQSRAVLGYEEGLRCQDGYNL